MKDFANRATWAGVLASCVLAGGCATKGFVRGELESMRDEMRAGDDRLSAEIANVGNSASEAMARAELALQYAGEARNLALGQVGYEEVASYTVRFPRDSHELPGDALMALEDAAALIRTHPQYVVDIYGFTDASGSASYNLLLGQKRAESVLRYLAERTTGSLQRFAAVSYGEERPIAGSSAENRRVQISVLQKTPETPPTDPSETKDSESDEEITSYLTR